MERPAINIALRAVPGVMSSSPSTTHPAARGHRDRLPLRRLGGAHARRLAGAAPGPARRCRRRRRPPAHPGPRPGVAPDLGRRRSPASTRPPRCGSTCMCSRCCGVGWLLGGHRGHRQGVGPAVPGSAASIDRPTEPAERPFERTEGDAHGANLWSTADGSPTGSMASGRVLRPPPPCAVLGHGSLIVRCVGRRDYCRSDCGCASGCPWARPVAADGARRTCPVGSESASTPPMRPCGVRFGSHPPNTSQPGGVFLHHGGQRGAVRVAPCCWHRRHPRLRPDSAMAAADAHAGRYASVAQPFPCSRHGPSPSPPLERSAATPSDGRPPTASATGIASASSAALGARHRARLHETTPHIWFERTNADIARERDTARANGGPHPHRPATTSRRRCSPWVSTAAMQPSMRLERKEPDPPETGERNGPDLARGDGEPSHRTVGRTTPLGARRGRGPDRGVPRSSDPLSMAPARSSRWPGWSPTNRAALPRCPSRSCATTRPPCWRVFNPTAPALFISAFWKASAVLPEWRGLPPPIALAGALTDIALGVRHWQRPPTDRQLRTVHAVALANAMIGLALSGTCLCPERTATGNPALGGDAPHGINPAHRQPLVPARPGTSIAGSCLPRLARHGPDPSTGPGPARHRRVLPTILTAFVPVWGLLGRLEGEAALLQDQLQADFADGASSVTRMCLLPSPTSPATSWPLLARRRARHLSDTLDGPTATQLAGECDQLEQRL